MKPFSKIYVITYVVHNVCLSLPVKVIQLLLQSFQTVTKVVTPPVWNAGLRRFLEQQPAVHANQ